MRILYVEDDPQDADLTQRYLADNAPELELDTVKTQLEAEIRLTENTFELVLTDLKLPQGDGIGLLAHIRKKALPVAVVIITGRGDEDTVVAALRAGADDYVIKRDNYLSHLPQTLFDAYQRYQAAKARKAHIIQVLYGEHNAADVDLALRYLKHYAPHIHMDVVSLGSAILQKLTAKDNPIDILLLDYRLPGMHALEVLKEIRQVHKIDIPAILTTGHGDEDVALQSLKLGAYDYIVKSEGYLHRLPAAIENAYYRAKLVREKRSLLESENKFRTLFENSADAIGVTKAGIHILCNPAYLTMFGYRHQDELVDTPVLSLISPNERERIADYNQQRIMGEQVPKSYETLGLRRDGALFDLDVRVSSYEIEEETYSVVILRDITERKRAEKEHQHLHEQVIRDANELEKRVQERTEQYETIIGLTVGRELRMAELKKVIKKLRTQLINAGLEPIADDPLGVGME